MNLILQYHNQRWDSKKQIRKILGLIPQSQIPKLLGVPVRKSQIANPQIFRLNLQIANLQISTKYCTLLCFKRGLKIVVLK
jgi:hypothetical protein